MAKDLKNKKTGAVKAIAWGAFAAQQAFVGYLVLNSYSNYVAVAASLVSLGIAVASIALVGACIQKKYGK